MAWWVTELVTLRRGRCNAGIQPRAPFLVESQVVTASPAAQKIPTSSGQQPLCRGIVMAARSGQVALRWLVSWAVRLETAGGLVPSDPPVDHVQNGSGPPRSSPLVSWKSRRTCTGPTTTRSQHTATLLQDTPGLLARKLGNFGPLNLPSFVWPHTTLMSSHFKSLKSAAKLIIT
ncbi:hypothetical protein HPB50_008142 [Hyalomma asiaticum]|uniref:Uncharacterized protein n=1 Tax=Hyalomma asiaticum TaxID=266040 RepID=A0ACB7TEJ8_HYAAI|nr:hypothetical protein HPB50_008142 [Hyalomma asiaticum]